MPTTQALAPPLPATGMPDGVRSSVRLRRAALLGGGALAGALAQAFGGWIALSLLVVVACVASFTVRGKSAAAPTSSTGGGSRGTRLAQQVVPVWQRTVQSAREHAEGSIGSLIENIGKVSEHLDQALGHDNAGGTLEIGAADELLERHAPEFQALQGHTLEMRDLLLRTQQAAQAIHGEMAGMQALAAQVQSIGRVTQLLATNAAVQAARAGAAGVGFAVVAQEVRGLAAEAREAGNQLMSRLDALRAGLQPVLRQTAETDHEDDEIARRAEQSSREVVRALLGSIQEVSRSTRDLRSSGRQIHADMERIFVALQSQDRLSQMLGSITDDMARYNNWLHGAEDPAATAPADWLARLEASYTMEEMRSSHHGNVVVDQAAGVEYF